MIHYGNVENGRSADGKQIFTARWKSRRLSHRAANIVSHSFAPLTVYTHYHSVYCCY